MAASVKMKVKTVFLLKPTYFFFLRLLTNKQNFIELKTKLKKSVPSEN
jgi:hypothetical protein